MEIFEKNLVFVSIGLVFYPKDYRKIEWLVVKPQKEFDFELPRIISRKTESTARALLRMAGEQLGMKIKIIDEVGRRAGTTKINGKTLPKKDIYYLAFLRSKPKEEVSIFQTAWIPLSKLLKLESLQGNKKMITEAERMAKEWLKKRKR